MFTRLKTDKADKLFKNPSEKGQKSRERNFLKFQKKSARGVKFIKKQGRNSL